MLSGLVPILIAAPFALSSDVHSFVRWHYKLRRQSFESKAGFVMSKRNESQEERATRKNLVKQQKSDKKARREGRLDDNYGQKPCTLCDEQKDLLIRCGLQCTFKTFMVKPLLSLEAILAAGAKLTSQINGTWCVASAGKKSVEA